MEELETASDVGMASGNPYAMAASAAFKVLSARQKRKQAEKETEARMKMDRIQRQQKALSGMMQMSQGLTI